MGFSKKVFSLRLKELRLQKGLTQQLLGEFVGTNKTTVNNWEKEVAAPGIDILWHLADFFEVSLDYLVGRSNDDPAVRPSFQGKVKKG